MKYVLYGLPCAGKTTLMNSLKIPVIHGSSELNRMTSEKFSDLPDDKKAELRLKYAEHLSARTDSFISDGHYSFPDGVVFTEADGNLYDTFFYLFCEPEVICKRLSNSLKNSRFSKLSAGYIKKWQNDEIKNLRTECHRRNKDFYIIKDISAEALQKFIEKIEGGFSSFSLAASITEKITEIFPAPCDLHIIDGDKTIINQDSFRICTNHYATHVFDDNFYTGYQSLMFTEEIRNLEYDTDKLSEIQLNPVIYSMTADKNYIILSSGVTQLWDKISVQFGLKNVIADTFISADTKYFVVKLLQIKGYVITAYGDSMNDYYMLKQADKSYLYIGSYLSRSLRNADISGIRLLYDKSHCILAETTNNISDDILICKSDSGINGSELADAHFRLGKMLGNMMREMIPSVNSAVIVLERGGRFFGDGIYTSFGGTFYSYRPQKEELPDIHEEIAVIVDSVINTGKSVIKTIDELRQKKPAIEIIIVSNVIQNNAAELLCKYKIFAVRMSANSFVGSRQALQKNGKGPDTADRLFNYID